VSAARAEIGSIAGTFRCKPGTLRVKRSECWQHWRLCRCRCRGAHRCRRCRLHTAGAYHRRRHRLTRSSPCTRIATQYYTIAGPLKIIQRLAPTPPLTSATRRTASAAVYPTAGPCSNASLQRNLGLCRGFNMHGTLPLKWLEKLKTGDRAPPLPGPCIALPRAAPHRATRGTQERGNPHNHRRAAQ